MHWLDNIFHSFVGMKYWVCRHPWCYRAATYQYRCHLHQRDK